MNGLKNTPLPSSMCRTISIKTMLKKLDVQEAERTMLCFPVTICLLQFSPQTESYECTLALTCRLVLLDFSRKRTCFESQLRLEARNDWRENASPYEIGQTFVVSRIQRTAVQKRERLRPLLSCSSICYFLGKFVGTFFS